MSASGTQGWLPLPPAVAVSVAITAVKLLLMPLYHSTDFEVHRNWMAITHNVPLSQWYKESTSQWTLDYPPFFAYFEYCLGHVFARLEPGMLTLQSDPYVTTGGKFLHRGTVILSDSVLIWAAWLYSRRHAKGSPWLTFALVVCNPALLLVDHVHFQYNGFLLGILILSITCIRSGQTLLGGALFAALLNFKHLYLVLAPVYFVYILRGWVLQAPRYAQRAQRFAGIGATVLAVFAAALVPVATSGQWKELLARLFPFDRGLLHAYWAPNFWSLYAMLDKALSALLKRQGRKQPARASLTGGLVQETVFSVLPQVNARACALLVLWSSLPCLIHLWQRPRKESMPRALAYAALCGFMFGFHVHEKAALTFLLPLALDALNSPPLGWEYVLVSTVVAYSMHPLLYEPQEYPVKFAIICVSQAATLLAVSRLPQGATERSPLEGEPQSDRADSTKASVAVSPSVRVLTCTYLAGLFGVEMYNALLHQHLFQGRLPFVPLMLVSVYCALAVTALWARMWAAYTYSVLEDSGIVGLCTLLFDPEKKSV